MDGRVAEVVLFNGYTCVYRNAADVFFYVVGAPHENELILMSVLDVLYDTCFMFFKDQVDALTILEHLSSMLLLLDEMIDAGIIIETTPEVLVDRIRVEVQTSKKLAKAASSAMDKGIDKLKRALLT